jgi:hypothetical protein
LIFSLIVVVSDISCHFFSCVSFKEKPWHFFA